MMDEEAIARFRARLDVYREKLDKANPFGDDIYSRHEALRYLIEALEVLATELGIQEHLRASGYERIGDAHP
jgi:hypothetical protein